MASGVHIFEVCGIPLVLSEIGLPAPVSAIVAGQASCLPPATQPVNSPGGQEKPR